MQQRTPLVTSRKRKNELKAADKGKAGVQIGPLGICFRQDARAQGATQLSWWSMPFPDGLEHNTDPGGEHVSAKFTLPRRGTTLAPEVRRALSLQGSPVIQSGLSWISLGMSPEYADSNGTRNADSQWVLYFVDGKLGGQPFHMSSARHLISLLKTHIRGDEQEFLSVAMEVAAREARQGHMKVAEQIRELVDQARTKATLVQKRGGSVVVLQPRGEMANLLSVSQPTLRFSSMVLPESLEKRLRRVLLEQRQKNKLRHHDLEVRRKLLFLGPPGTGKTMTAAALAGELHLPLFTILLEGVITKFMGETAAKLRLIFETMNVEKGVYLFDEFDAIGARRTQVNDVGEIRRVLNSFLQLLEKDESNSLIIAATNHPDLLDKALFRRFDDVIAYCLPDRKTAVEVIETRLARFNVTDLDWERVGGEVTGLSQAELVRASDEAAKNAILEGTDRIKTEELVAALNERKHASRSTDR